MSVELNRGQSLSHQNYFLPKMREVVEFFDLYIFKKRIDVSLSRMVCSHLLKGRALDQIIF